MGVKFRQNIHQGFLFGGAQRVKQQLRQSGRKVWMVENCSMENEKIYRSLEDIPDDAGYFSLVIAKE